MRDDTVFLQLGRLDGRLANSPARLAWQLNMRLRGMALAAENAGIPVELDDLRVWLSGRSMPPRHREGLNDPVAITTVAFYYIEALKAGGAAGDVAADEMLRSVFDHRQMALDWAPHELLNFKAVSLLLQQKCRVSSIKEIAACCTKLLAVAFEYNPPGHPVALTANFPDFVRTMPLAWLISIKLPLLLRDAGITKILMPNLVPSMRHANLSPNQVETVVMKRLATEIGFGHRELDRLEHIYLRFHSASSAATKRSRVRAAADIVFAFPNIRRTRLAGSIGTTPQGAGLLIKQIDSLAACAG
jgi:hypothetical protein